jgi:cytochrome c oxidase assembly factor CtaG
MLPHVHNGPASWECPVWLTVAVVLVAVGCMRGWLQLWFSSNAIPAWRAVSFLSGLALTWIAVASPIGAGNGRLLTFHMVQHLLLMTVAPPLILLGEPLLALRLGRPFHPKVERVGRALSHPALCWMAATATLVGWHIPAAFAVAFGSPAWHAVEQVSFLVAGLLFWWPVVQPWPTPAEPRWSTVLYLFLATLPCDILSGFLVFSDRIAYSVYLPTSSSLAVLDDQQCAGALMWTVVTIVYLVAGTIVSTQLLVSPSPRHRLAEVV